MKLYHLWDCEGQFSGKGWSPISVLKLAMCPFGETSWMIVHNCTAAHGSGSVQVIDEFG